jgi:hypothetical protein
MWLQGTIKKALEDNPGMTTQQFISALESKGINLLFNQASTGYVSGVSYSYEGFLVTGSKLGNDFKWTAIKNMLDYEQERDRGAIRQANDRTRSIKVESGAGIVNRKGGINPLLEESKRLHLPVRRSFGEGGASLLDGLSRGVNRGIDDRSDMDLESLVKRRKRRRKRRSKGL